MSASKQIAEVEEFVDALYGVPPWFMRLRRALAAVDERAARVLRKRVEEQNTMWEDSDGRLCRQPPDEILGSAFDWSETVEGHRYWSRVRDRLAAAARKAPPRRSARRTQWAPQALAKP